MLPNPASTAASPSGSAGAACRRQQNRILVRGSINIDEFFTVPDIVRSGQSIAASGYAKRAGGKGANQAVAAARARVSIPVNGVGEVDFIGSVGSDGQWLKDTLKGLGVNTLLVDTHHLTPTGRAMIQVSSTTHDNSIIVLSGANASTLPLPTDFSPWSLILLQNEIPLAETTLFLTAARAAGLITVFNPSPMLSEAEALAFPWKSVNYLIVNEDEALLLTSSLRKAAAAINFSSEVRNIAKDTLTLHVVAALMEAGADGFYVVVTRGAEGAEMAWFGSGIYHDDIVQLDSTRLSISVQDTTGAGDCFAGYFAQRIAGTECSLTSFSSIQCAARVAVHAAAMSVERDGAMESYPTDESVRVRMEGA